MSERKDLNQVEIGVRLPSGNFTRNIFTKIDKISSMRKKYKNRGVYVTAYCYEDAANKTEDSLLYGHLYIDLDLNELTEPDKEYEAFEKIREDGIKSISFLSAIMGIDEEMIKIYYSGQKGLHIVVPAKVLGLKPIKELNHVFKVIAKEVHTMSRHKTIDTSIYDNARLFALPGVQHPKTGRHKIPLSFNELRTLSFDNVKKLSAKKRTMKYKAPRYNTKAHRIFQSYIEDWEKEKAEQGRKSKSGYERNLDFCPPCIDSILKTPCGAGARNNTAAVLASYFKQRGWSKEKGWKLIVRWNEEFANLPKGELETTFESIYAGDYVYGCSTLEMLGDCQRDKCKIGQNRDKKKDKSKDTK